MEAHSVGADLAKAINKQHPAAKHQLCENEYLTEWAIRFTVHPKLPEKKALFKL